MTKNVKFAQDPRKSMLLSLAYDGVALGEAAGAKPLKEGQGFTR
jgi:hypothetical protein